MKIFFLFAAAFAGRISSFSDADTTTTESTTTTVASTTTPVTTTASTTTTSTTTQSTTTTSTTTTASTTTTSTTTTQSTTTSSTTTESTTTTTASTTTASTTTASTTTESTTTTTASTTTASTTTASTTTESTTTTASTTTTKATTTTAATTTTTKATTTTTAPTTTTTANTTTTQPPTTTAAITTTLAPCPAVPAAPKNQTWVAKDSTNTTQFIANAAFRVWTKFEYAPHKGYCPGALDFTDTKKVTAKHLILDGDEWVSVMFNETVGNKTKELELVLKNNGVDYFVQNVSVTFSWNNFEGSNDTTAKTIRNDKIHGYPVPAGKAYNCQAAAEVQLAPEEKQIQGLKIQPAIWEAFSDFGNRTVVNNTDECLFDFNDVTTEKVSWNITVTDGKNTTVCGKLAMSTLVNVNYTSILGEDMVANFAISNTTEITHSMSKKCSNDSLSVTFWIKELDFNAANITMDFTTNTNGTFWSLSHATLSYPNGGNPLFPNTNVHAGVTTISSNATLFNTTYGSAFMCHDKHWINATDTWYMQIEDVTIQPFNLTNQDYGAFEDCKEDMKDDWLIPVIVGSVLGGLVIVVVVAYVIGRRRQIEDENQESVENENYSD